MSKYNTKCVSCGIDISFDDIPTNGNIECGVCGANVKFTVPKEKPSTPVINVSASQKFKIIDPKPADAPPETSNKKSNEAFMASAQKESIEAPPIIARNFQEKSSKAPSKQKTANASKKGFPWILILYSILSLALIIAIFIAIGIKNRKTAKANTPATVPVVVKNDLTPSNTTSAVGDDEKKIAGEKKKTDEEKFKSLLLAEANISAESIEKGKDKSANEIREEVNVEHKRIIDEKFPESMLEQIKQDASLKFNMDDMPTADIKFSQEMLTRITEEAKEKFKLIKIGDTITVPKRQSAGYIYVTGTYYGIAGDKIIVKESKILISELPSDIRDRIIEDNANKKRLAYIRENYHIPREKYEKQRSIELEKVKGYVENHIQSNYYIPREAFRKTSKQETEEKLFKEYGFVFNKTKNAWEHFGDFFKSKYSEHMDLKK